MTPLLIVDGDRCFREALAIALRLDGVAVEAVGSVGEARRSMAARPFALVVVDSLLPGADALLADLAAAGRARVVATGPHRELLASAAARHAVRTLEKPFQAEDLAQL